MSTNPQPTPGGGNEWAMWRGVTAAHYAHDFVYPGRLESSPRSAPYELRELGEEIFVDEARIHILVPPDRAVAPAVDIMHLRIENRRRPA